MSVLSRPYFHDEEAALGFVEGILWPKGPICPHCGGTDRVTAVKPNPEKRIRYGLKRCGDCKGQFTVRIGTIFEESKLPMTKWLQAIFLMTASKKGVSAHQLHRTLEVTYKTAWFLAHRIREAMRDGELAPFGGEGGMVEVDETYIGQNPDAGETKMAIHKMNAVMTLIDRDSGRARSMVVDRLDAAAVAEILSANLAREARLMTDEAKFYIGPEGVRRPPQGFPRPRRIRFQGRPHRAHQHGRGLLQHFQTGNAWGLSALRAQAPAPLCGGVRLPLQHPLRPWGR